MEWNEPLYKQGTGENSGLDVPLSHGFTGSPRSMHEWALRLADAGYTVAVQRTIGSKHKALVKLEDSFHVATMDNDKELIFAKTLGFIATHAGGR